MVRLSAVMHGAVTGLGSDIWLTESPDLIHWGRHRLLLAARRGAWWDANKIGLGPPLIETERGWLMLYHGMRQTAAGCLYRLGLALLDPADPGRVLLRGSEWVLGPRESYERLGDVADVVFPCGATIGPGALVSPTDAYGQCTGLCSEGTVGTL